MSKHLGPVVNFAGAKAEKLYLKGERCFTPKCHLRNRSFAPGQHGRMEAWWRHRTGRDV